VVGLSGHRPQPAHLPVDPLQHLVLAAQVLGQELARLLGEVLQDRARLEDRDGAPTAPSFASRGFVIDDRRNAVVGLILRNSGLNCSPVPMFTGTIL